MRLAKKFLSLGIAAILSCVTIMASAAEPTIVTDTENRAITVSGKIEGETRKGSTLIFKLTDSSDNVIYADYTNSKFDENKNVVYEFEKLFLPADFVSGTYKVYVSGAELAEPQFITYEYSGPDRVLEVLKALSLADKTGSVLPLQTDGIYNYVILGVDIAEYNGLGETGELAFENIMDELAYDLPESYLTDLEKQKIQTGLTNFLSKYKRAIASGYFAAADESGEVNAWIEKYYDYLGFNANTEITAVLSATKGDGDFVKRIAKKTEPMTIEEIKAYMYESALLSTICEKTDGEVKDVIFDFPTYFPIDKDAYDDLIPADQAKVIAAVSGTSYEDCDAVVDKFDGQVKLLLNKDDDNKGGGGGSKHSPSSGLIAPANKPEAVPETPKAPVFSDLGEAAWAEQAILFLNEKGIVNGNPDGSFGPNNNITRAEFVKLIATAIGIDASDTLPPFGDVSADCWYAPYVSAAYKWGVVKGDEYGNFYPEACITRQDMVAMLYRAIGGQASDNDTLSFTDAASISDYAKDAVAYFNKLGVVNGFEDGSFGPLNNATRAEAAMIFYKLITAEL